jgi:hypothetical protein
MDGDKSGFKHTWSVPLNLAVPSEQRPDLTCCQTRLLTQDNKTAAWILGMHQVLPTSAQGITFIWADVILLHRSKTRPACTCIAVLINSDQTVYRHTRNVTHSDTEQTVYRRSRIVMHSKSDHIHFQFTRNKTRSNTNPTVYWRACIVLHSKSDHIHYQLTRNITHSNTDLTLY